VDAAFNTDPGLTALALAGAPRGEALSRAFRVAVASGVPVMLWERGRDPRPLDQDACATGCAAPGRGDCPDGRFLRAARKALTGTHRDALPDRVYDLRNEAELHELEADPDPERTTATDPATATATAPDGQNAPLGQDAPLGHRVVLLWDDPARQLPRTRLAPATATTAPPAATAQPAATAPPTTVEGPPSVPSPRTQEGLPR
ncbi:hypothetical protein ACFV6F_15690, partial [Kitasatospora phosalacinea]